MSDTIQDAMKDVFEAAARCGFLEEAQRVHAEIDRLRRELAEASEQSHSDKEWDGLEAHFRAVCDENKGLRAELAEAKERMRLKDEAIARLTNSVLDKGRWIAELERKLADVKASSEVGELLKVALNMPGTGSYIEWAKECRAAYDELDRLCDDNVKLTEAYDDLNIQFERAAGHAAECENGEKEALSKLAEARGRISEAESLINYAALEIMTTDQLGRWAGVRAWIEDVGGER